MNLPETKEIVLEFFNQLTGLGSLAALIVYVPLLEALGEKITNRILIIAAIINSAIVYGLKQFFATPRPQGVEQLTYSFPSGHAATAFMIAAVLGWRYPKIKYLILTIAALVATSRIIIGVHYIQDVIAGSIIGLTIGTLTVWKMESLIEQNDWFSNIT